MKGILYAALLLSFIAPIFIAPIFAHTLKIDGQVGIIVHIDPDDEPISGQKSNIFVEIEDRSKRFNILNCDCLLLIERDGQEIARMPLASDGFYNQLKFTFPSSGIYLIKVSGKPISNENTFQDFYLEYEYYVSAGPISEYPDISGTVIDFSQAENSLQNYLPYATIFGLLIIILMFLLELGSYIQKIIYSFSIIWAIFLFYYVSYSIPTQASALSSLGKYYGLTSLYLLFIVFIPGLFNIYFSTFSLNSLLLAARRAIGVSVFLFGLLHALIGFFINLSGSFQSISFLSRNYQLDLIFSLIALFIFSIMALTSFDYAMKVLGKKWKILHRFVYVAAILVIFHAFIIGSHFTNPKSFIPLAVNLSALAIIILESGATIKRLRDNQKIIPLRKYLSYSGVGIIVIVSILLSVYSITKGAYDPHAQHRASPDVFLLNISKSPIPESPIPKSPNEKGGSIIGFNTFFQKLINTKWLVS